MLKRTGQSGAMPTAPEERPVGDLVHDLVENGKAYARAEADLAKAMAAAKANALKVPGILFGAALAILLSAVTVLGVGFVMGLAPLIGPVLSGIVVFVVMAAIAGGCAWYGAKRLREDL